MQTAKYQVILHLRVTVIYRTTMRFVTLLYLYVLSIAIQVFTSVQLLTNETTFV